MFLNNLKISYSIAYTYRPDNTAVIISSGFDCNLIYWDIDKKIDYKIINL